MTQKSEQSVGKRPQSSARLRRARLTALFALLRKERGYFNILKATGNHVSIRFGDAEVNFHWHEGYVTRSVGDNTYLSDEDYALLYALAEMLMKAVFEGYKKEKTTRKKRKGSDAGKQLTWKF